MSGYLADTSIFIAAERGRELGDPPPGQSRISVMTLTELLVGFRMAHGTTTAALRERTLAKARAFMTIPYDEPVADALAELLVSAKAQDRRAPMPDAVIAATALVHKLTVWTLDRDFEVLAELEPELQIQMP